MGRRRYWPHATACILYEPLRTLWSANSILDFKVVSGRARRIWNVRSDTWCGQNALMSCNGVLNFGYVMACLLNYFFLPLGLFQSWGVWLHMIRCPKMIYTNRMDIEILICWLLAKKICLRIIDIKKWNRSCIRKMLPALFDWSIIGCTILRLALINQLLTCSIVNPVSCANCFFWSSEGYGCCNKEKHILNETSRPPMEFENIQLLSNKSKLILIKLAPPFSRPIVWTIRF